MGGNYEIRVRLEQIEDELDTIKEQLAEQTGDDVPENIEPEAWEHISQFGDPQIVDVVHPYTFVVDGEGDTWVLDEDSGPVDQPPLVLGEIERIAEVARDKK
jgi:hypothetical protein